MHNFATWLYASAPSTLIRSQEVWIIPTIQSIHIVGIATAVGSAFMIAMRRDRLAGRVDQTLLQTQRRYGPWPDRLALWLLLATGLLLVLAEPPRELDAVSFWLKMALVALMAVIAFTFQRSVRRDDDRWETTIIRQAWVKWAALLTFLVWAAIIFLGRFIAYDQIWNRVFPGIKG